MLNLNLDDFADYCVEVTVDGYAYLKHRTCKHSELLQLDSIPVKFLMVKATEHHLEFHNADATRSDKSSK